MASLSEKGRWRPGYRLAGRTLRGLHLITKGQNSGTGLLFSNSSSEGFSNSRLKGLFFIIIFIRFSVFIFSYQGLNPRAHAC